MFPSVDDSSWWCGDRHSLCLDSVPDIEQREDSGGPWPVAAWSHCEGLTVFVNRLVKQFAICLGVVVGFNLLLNVMEVFSVFVWRKLSPHLGVWELDHRCLLSSCCLLGWFCILCDRVRACSCYASCPLVCSACLTSVWCLWKLCWQCVCWWVWWSKRKRTLCLL